MLADQSAISIANSETGHPDRQLTPAEQHHPRGLVAAATGIAAHLHPVMHAVTSGLI
jgi:hypothetical protein